MFGQLTMTLKVPISRSFALKALMTIIGENSITVRAAVAGTRQSHIAGIALCAEKAFHRDKIIYMMAGPDMLIAYIFTNSLSQIRAQCGRISRQVAAQGLAMVAVEATVLVMVGAAERAILSGEKVALSRRFRTALNDRFIGRIVPALVTVSFATHLMANTPALMSAKIGLVAALAGAFFDATVAALAAENWQWKESKW